MKKNLIVVILLITSVAVQSQIQANKSLPLTKTVKVYTTDSSKYRLAMTDNLKFTDFPQPLETDICIFVDPTRQFQTMLGIGGALTDASAETYAKLPIAKQEELIRAYYDTEKGIGYTLARTNMNSCDFSSDSYTYVADNDKMLNTFDIKHDQRFRIPFIKDAIKAAGGKLTLFISPWSPPAWMKRPKRICGIHSRLLTRHDSTELTAKFQTEPTARPQNPASIHQTPWARRDCASA